MCFSSMTKKAGKTVMDHKLHCAYLVTNVSIEAFCKTTTKKQALKLSHMSLEPSIITLILCQSV